MRPNTAREWSGSSAASRRHRPAATRPPQNQPLLPGIGPHGGGPPGSVVFYSARDGNLEVYSMNADGSGERPLTTDPDQDIWPDMSPNGHHIAFASDRTGDFEIYVLDLRDGSLLNVSQDPALLALVASVPVASGQSVRFKGPVADLDVIHQQAASLFETPAAWCRAHDDATPEVLLPRVRPIVPPPWAGIAQRRIESRNLGSAQSGKPCAAGRGRPGAADLGLVRRSDSGLPQQGLGGVQRLQ